jgi:hypothetical protein
MNGRRFTISCGISCRVLGIGFLIPSFDRRTNGIIPLALSILIALGSPIWERWLAAMTVESALMTRAQAAVVGHRCLVE